MCNFSYIPRGFVRSSISFNATWFFFSPFLLFSGFFSRLIRVRTCADIICTSSIFIWFSLIYRGAIFYAFPSFGASMVFFFSFLRWRVECVRVRSGRALSFHPHQMFTHFIKSLRSCIHLTATAPTSSPPPLLFSNHSMCVCIFLLICTSFSTCLQFFIQATQTRLVFVFFFHCYTSSCQFFFRRRCLFNLMSCKILRWIIEKVINKIDNKMYAYASTSACVCVHVKRASYDVIFLSVLTRTTSIIHVDSSIRQWKR